VAPTDIAATVAAPADDALARAREVLVTEADAVRALADRLDTRFAHAVAIVLACRGRVVVSGVGKSGHIARKLAATLASTGTPAFFLHAAEANHGDLGMIQPDDVLLALSYSGESEELTSIVPIAKRRGAKLVVMSGAGESSLARHADVWLDTHVDKEACPMKLAPTASTTAMLALGDALAVALLEARGFGPEDFARSHPGGTLGRRLLTLVADVMRAGDAVPIVAADALLDKVVLEMSAKGMGMTSIVDPSGRLVGIFTDGDLRRALERGVDLHDTLVAAVMTANPRTITADRLAAEAVALMEAKKIHQLVVVDAQGRPVGAFNMHDLFRAKVL
jgi:arabinose-5-phosphate isomerase